MPAKKGIRVKAMYEAYSLGQPLDHVAQDFRSTPEELVAEFRERGWDLREPDAAQYPAPVRPVLMRAEGGGRAGRRRGRPPMDAEAVEAMHAAYLAGHTLAEVAKNYSKSPATVGALFKRHGLEVRPRGTRTFPEDLARAMHGAYQQGATISALAEEHELSSQQVRGAFRQYGLPLKGTKTKVSTSMDSDQVRALYGRFEGGEDLSAVAESARITASQLRRLFLINHLPLQPVKQHLAKPRPAPPPPPPEPAPADPWGIAEPVEAPTATIDPDLARRLYEGYSGGKSLLDLGGKFKRSAVEVAELMAAAGYRLRARDCLLVDSLREQLALEAHSLHREGYSLREIAGIFDCPEALVARLLE